jgi:hypothetical protein
MLADIREIGKITPIAIKDCDMGLIEEAPSWHNERSIR